MGRAKKLQVFVSSTYADLRAERQAAVEAILTAGHIPAGMELFTAGDQTQMEVIKQWIRESDVFLLILAGRYGSIEPTSRKSYIQLEYEFAFECNKPLFAVAITEEHLDTKNHAAGKSVLEMDHPQKLKEFRAQILTRLVKFWSDPRDIKLAVIETLSQFARRDELIGWVPGDEASKTNILVDEIARLTKENSQARDELSRIRRSTITYNGLTFEEMGKLLLEEKLAADAGGKRSSHFHEAAIAFGDQETSLLHVFWSMGAELGRGLYLNSGDPEQKVFEQLSLFGLVSSRFGEDFRLSEEGKNFFLRMKVERGNEATNRCIL